MRDPVVAFALVLLIGVVAGVVFDRFVGRSWLARQIGNSSRGLTTSALVGVAGAFIGWHLLILAAAGGPACMPFVAAALDAAAVLLLWRTIK